MRAHGVLPLPCMFGMRRRSRSLCRGRPMRALHSTTRVKTFRRTSRSRESRQCNQRTSDCPASCSRLRTPVPASPHAAFSSRIRAPQSSYRLSCAPTMHVDDALLLKTYVMRPFADTNLLASASNLKQRACIDRFHRGGNRASGRRFCPREDLATRRVRNLMSGYAIARQIHQRGSLWHRRRVDKATSRDAFGVHQHLYADLRRSPVRHVLVALARLRCGTWHAASSPGLVPGSSGLVRARTAHSSPLARRHRQQTCRDTSAGAAPHLRMRARRLRCHGRCGVEVERAGDGEGGGGVRGWASAVECWRVGALAL